MAERLCKSAEQLEEDKTMSNASVLVEINLGVNRETAETALKLIDLYLQQNEGATIIESTDEQGRIHHEFNR